MEWGILAVCAVFVALSWLSIKRHEKHDRVLFAFCDLRRELMAFLRGRVLETMPPASAPQKQKLSAALPPAELKAALVLLNNLNNAISHYSQHKENFYGWRKTKNAIKKDARKRQKMRQHALAQLNALPQNSPLRCVCVKIGFIALDSLFVYTPLLRAKFITRLLFGSIAQQINAMRQEWQKERGKKPVIIAHLV